MLPRFRRGAFIVFALAFVATMLLGDAVGAQLLLVPAELLAGRGLWRPLTAMFTYPEPMRAAIVVTLAVQWLVAGRLEEFWGTRRYLVMVLVSALAGYGASVALAAALPSLEPLGLGGPAPLDVAAATAFAVSHGGQTFRPVGSTPLRGRTLGLLVALVAFALPWIGFLRGAQTLPQTWPAVVPSAIAAISALVFVVRPKRGPRAPASAGSGPRPRAGSHLRVVRSADDLLN